MLKVGIMTWFQYHNYGTALQVTAMSKILEKMGHSPVVIKYYTKPEIDNNRDSSFIIFFACKVLRRLKRIGRSQYLLKIREKKFEDFLTKNLSFSDRCDTFSELNALNQIFDYFVCGSDQIWAPSCFDSHYFLDFVSDNNKKIAYAPSVGLPRIEDNKVKGEIARLCLQFAHLSTREESGSKIIHDITGREVKTVLDPTLLLSKEEWSDFEPKNVEIHHSPYLLVYMLGQNEQHWEMIYKISEQLKLKIRIIPVFRRDYLRKDCIKEPVGPAEFLSLVDSASFVCTDSFHGMAFSVNYGKQFVVFERFACDDPINQNSRIYNLAEKLGLGSRIISKENGINTIFNQIDYNPVQHNLNLLITESIEYLTNSLNPLNSR